MELWFSRGEVLVTLIHKGWIIGAMGFESLMEVGCRKMGEELEIVNKVEYRQLF